MSRFDASLLERALQAIGKPAPPPAGNFEDLAVQVTLELIERFEGMSLAPYLCPAGVATIGLGSTTYADGRRVKLTDPPISEAQARRLAYLKVRKEFLPAVLMLCPGVIDARRLAALVDFTYNLGAGNLRASTLLRRAVAGRWDDVKTELMRWVRAGGIVLRGLVLRRAAEAALI